jgi:hypothetical protein
MLLSKCPVACPPIWLIENRLVLGPFDCPRDVPLYHYGYDRSCHLCFVRDQLRVDFLIADLTAEM